MEVSDDVYAIEIDSESEFRFLINGWNRLAKLPTLCERGWNDVSGSQQNVRALEKKLGALTGDGLLTFSQELESREFEITYVNLFLLKAQHRAEERLRRNAAFCNRFEWMEEAMRRTGSSDCWCGAIYSRYSTKLRSWWEAVDRGRHVIAAHLGGEAIAIVVCPKCYKEHYATAKNS